MKKNALRIGMSLEEFWHGNPQDFYIYLDAYIEKREEEKELEDYRAWKHNIYTLKALQQVMAKNGSAGIFPKKPFNKTSHKDIFDEQTYQLELNKE